MNVPGPWQLYLIGSELICREERKEGFGRCGRVVLRAGRRKSCFVRIVGTRLVPMPADIDGMTIRCKCQTVYEVDWEDRRTLPRDSPDRRAAPGPGRREATG